jgi:hypothetical protein
VREEQKNRVDEMLDHLTSPFGSTDLRMKKLTAVSRSATMNAVTKICGSTEIGRA